MISEVYYQPDIETMPREQLRELQLERMRRSIRHAYDNVAFYQRTFKEAGITPDDLTSLEDLTRFPFVVKQDMRDAYPFGLFAVPQKDVARIHASSGTTGQATVVGHTKNDLANWGDCFARGIAMVGGDENSTIQVSYGYGLFTGGLGAHYGGEAADLQANKTTLAPAGYDWVVQDAYDLQKKGESGGIITPIFSKAVQATTEYSADLNSLWQEAYVDCVTCSPDEFESKYEEYCQEYLDAGYQEILDEKASLIADGNVLVVK